MVDKRVLKFGENPKRAAYYLFFSQLAAHLSLLPMLIFASWHHYLVSVFIYFLTGCLGMTMTYHRLLSHRSWNPPKFLEYFFVLLATVGLTGSAISWVAVHRKHHRYTDQPGDPHSPYYKGWFYCHFLSMFIKVDVKYAIDLVREPFYRFQHKYYYPINAVYALFVVFFFRDPLALIYAWLFPAAVLWNGGSSIVSLSHRDKRSHTDTILSFLVWGEGYHEQHHRNPCLSRFGRYDLGGFLIKRLSGRKTKVSPEKA